MPLMMRQPGASLSLARLRCSIRLCTAICDVVGFPEFDLRVIAPDVGGGFGQKMSLAGEYVVLVWLVIKLKSWVKLMFEDPREESHRRLSLA